MRESLNGSVPSGHNVVVVDDLDERLNAGAGQHLTTRHGLRNGAGVAVDSNNDGVRERTSLGDVLDGLDDDGLASGILALGENDNLTLLQELDHSVFLFTPNTKEDDKQHAEVSTGSKIRKLGAEHSIRSNARYFASMPTPITQG